MRIPIYSDIISNSFDGTLNVWAHTNHEAGCDMIWVMTFDTKANQESDKLTEQSDT